MEVIGVDSPTVEPSVLPTVVPTTTVPTVTPTVTPTVKPTRSPTIVPTVVPTVIPTIVPTTSSPTIIPTVVPTTTIPTVIPTIVPTQLPTVVPTVVPTVKPTTTAPTVVPSIVPTQLPTIVPTVVPTVQPSVIPTAKPTTTSPTVIPTIQPSFSPTVMPTVVPTVIPTLTPTVSPSQFPTSQPSGQPSRQPTSQPTKSPARPTTQPSSSPTCQPSRRPTNQPTSQPTQQPTCQPTSQPSRQPSSQPTRTPTRQPTSQPTLQPTSQPSLTPTQPTGQPTRQPTSQPTRVPSAQPSSEPTRQPSSQPTRQPTGQPSRIPTMQPTRQPTRRPSGQPTRVPTCQPSSTPTRQPTMQPSRQPTSQPSAWPTRQPSSQPSGQPTDRPTSVPTTQPSRQPTRRPSSQPTRLPTCQPTTQPSMQPSSQPTSQPTRQPTRQPTSQPTRVPTSQPSSVPTRQPTMQPSRQPTAQPTSQPTRLPTMQPSVQPTAQPTGQPSRMPSMQPTVQPTRQPSARPTSQPSAQPTRQPTRVPTAQPSRQPTRQPTSQPSGQPSRIPSMQPTAQPSGMPSSQPTVQPTAQPTSQPSRIPSMQPTTQPSRKPSMQPSSQPSRRPTRQPTGQPSRRPTSQPTRQPTTQPTAQPSRVPTMQPSSRPTSQPSSQPTRQPTTQPSAKPSRQPTAQPSRQPTGRPSSQPSRRPTAQPSRVPSTQPSSQPTRQPTMQPSSQPSRRPTSQPSRVPSRQPTGQPSRQPTRQPSSQPTTKPSVQPSAQPSNQPTSRPSNQPTTQPSIQPSSVPTTQPTRQPTGQPSNDPTQQPTSQPTRQPSTQPTGRPSMQPTSQPSGQPSTQPTGRPSTQPSRQPSSQPTRMPSRQPTAQPSDQPTRQPSAQPSRQPTRQPTSQPSRQPTMQPSAQPSVQPTMQPSVQPTSQPSGQPSVQPTAQPTHMPSTQPTRCPSGQPSAQPSRQPSSQPSRVPTGQPTMQPTHTPSTQPTTQPTCQPSFSLSGRYVHISSMVNTPLVGSLATVNSKYQLYIEVTLASKEDTTIYCAAYKSLSSYWQPASQDDIISYDFRTLVSSTRPYVLISGLTPSTPYNVYCMTVSLIGDKMPYEELLNNMIPATTLCCKVATIDLTASVYVGATYFNLISVSVDAAPNYQLGVHLGLNGTDSGTLYPTVVSIASSAIPTTVYAVSYSAGSVSGFFDVNTTLIGTSASEYQVQYTHNSRIQVLALNADPPIPVLSSAFFAADGTSVTVEFDSATNQANYKNAFPCNKILKFNNIRNALCTWTDSRHISLSFNGSVIVPTKAMLNVGDNVTIIAKNSVRAACVIANLTQCAYFKTVRFQNVTVHAPTAPQLPVVIISAPTLIPPCNSLTMDITLSYGNAGRDWQSATYHVLDSIDRIAFGVESFMNHNYTMSYPGNVIPASLFVGGHAYTFQVTLCNFLGACSSSSQIVTVLNATNSVVPIVNILGAQFISTTRNMPLSVTATAYTQSCDGMQQFNNLNYSWTLKIVSTLPNVTGIPSISSNALVYKLPAYVLKQQTQYTLTLKVFSTLSKRSSSAAVTITVANGAIIAQLASAGATRVITPGSYLTLDASGSYDTNFPASAAATNSRLIYSWTCLQLTPVLNPSVCMLRFVNYNASVGYPWARLLNVTTAAGASAMVNSTYRVTVTVTDSSDGRSSAAFSDVRITMLPANVVSVTTTFALTTATPSSTVFTVNPTDRIQLVGSLQLVSTCNAAWSISEPIVNLETSALNPITAVYQVSALNAVQTYNLLLSPNTLQPRSTYTFKLSCAATSSVLASSAAITILTNGAPLPGQFTVTPQVGVELSTQFLFTAALWSDPDLPLSYQMAYVVPVSAVPVYQVILSRSALSYGSSILPAGSSANLLNITASLNVYDNYGAYASKNQSVRVVPSADRTAQFQAYSALLSTVSSASTDTSKQVVNSIATSMNSVNCSGAPSCSTLHRSACLATDHTCSSCLSGYTGDAGDHNTPCISLTEFHSVTANVAAYLNTNITGNDTKPIQCHRDSDCGSSWFRCHLIPTPRPNVTVVSDGIANNTCVLISKQCSNNCSGAGVCTFYNINSRSILSDCKVNNASCAAACKCNAGVYGATCELTFEELRDAQCVRSQLVSNLRNLTLVDDVNDNNIISWSSALYSISQNPFEISLTDANTMAVIADSIVANANILDLRQYESILTVLYSVDSLSSMSSYSKFSCSASSALDVVSMNNTPGNSIVSVAGQFGSLVGAQMVLGQAESVYVYDNFRLVVGLHSAEEGQFNFSSPLTSFEQVTGLIASSITVAPVEPVVVVVAPNSTTGANSTSSSVRRLTSSVNGNFITNLIETRSKVYGDPVALRLISNAYHLELSLKDSTTTSSALEGVTEVEFSISNLEYQTRYQTDYVSINFTTTCNGVTDVANYTYLCADSDTLLIHNCTGTVGTFTSYCPKPWPICNYLDISSSSNGGTVGLYEVDACSVKSHTEMTTTCVCSVNGAHLRERSRRKMYGVYHDPAGHVSNAFNSQGVTNMGTTSTFIPYQIHASFVPLIVIPAKDPQLVFTMVILFGCIYFLCLLSTGWDKAKERFTVVGSKKFSKTSSGRFKPAVAPVLFNTSKAEPKNSLTAEDMHRELSDYFYSMLPPIFGNTKNAAIGDKTLIQCIGDEILRNHRYLSIFGHRGKNHREHTIVMFRWLSIQALTIFVVAVLCAFQARTDDDYCPSQTTEAACLQRHTFIDHDYTYCEWVPDPTAPFPTTAIHICQYRVPVFSYRVLFIIVIITFGVVTAFTLPLDWLLRRLFAPTFMCDEKPLWQMFRESCFRKKIVVNPLEDYEDTGDVFSRRGSVARRASVASVAEGEAPALPVYVINRCVPSGVQDKRREVVAHLHSFRSHTKYTALHPNGSAKSYGSWFNDIEHTGGSGKEQQISAASPTINNNNASSFFQPSASAVVPHNDAEDVNYGNNSLMAPVDFAEHPLFDEIIAERENFDYRERTKRALLERRRLQLGATPDSVKNPTMTIEGEEGSSRAAEEGVGSAKGELTSSKILADHAHVKLFDRQWGVVRDEVTDGYDIRSEVRVAISKDLQVVHSLAVMQEERVLAGSSEAHMGLNVIHWFVVDVLRSDAPAGVIVHKKMQTEFPSQVVVSRKFWCFLFVVFLLSNAFFCAYSVYLSYGRSLYWQFHFLFLVLALMVMESLIVSTVECLLLHVLIPNTVRIQWNTFARVLNTLIERLSGDNDDDEDGVERSVVRKYKLNAASHLFVSHLLARQHSSLIESELVSSYSTDLPGQLSKTWHSTLTYTSPDIIPVVVPRKVNYKLSTKILTRIKRNWMWAWQHTVKFVCDTTDRISVEVVKVLRYAGVHFSYQFLSVFVRIFLTVAVCGSALLWYYVVYHTNIEGMVLLALANLIILSYCIIASILYISSYNKGYLRPIRKQTRVAPVRNSVVMRDVSILNDLERSNKIALLNLSSSSSEGEGDSDSGSDDIFAIHKHEEAKKGDGENNEGEDHDEDEAADEFNAEEGLSGFRGGTPKKPKKDRRSFMDLPSDVVQEGKISARIRKDALEFSDDEDDDEDNESDESEDDDDGDGTGTGEEESSDRPETESDYLDTEPTLDESPVVLNSPLRNSAGAVVAPLRPSQMLKMSHFDESEEESEDESSRPNTSEDDHQHFNRPHSKQDNKREHRKKGKKSKHHHEKKTTSSSSSGKEKHSPTSAASEDRPVTAPSSPAAATTGSVSVSLKATFQSVSAVQSLLEQAREQRRTFMMPSQVVAARQSFLASRSPLQIGVAHTTARPTDVPLSPLTQNHSDGDPADRDDDNEDQEEKVSSSGDEVGGSGSRPGSRPTSSSSHLVATLDSHGKPTIVVNGRKSVRMSMRSKSGSSGSPFIPKLSLTSSPRASEIAENDVPFPETSGNPPEELRNVDAIEVLSPSAMLRLGGAGNSFREEDEEFDEEENNDD